MSHPLRVTFFGFLNFGRLFLNFVSEFSLPPAKAGVEGERKEKCQILVLDNILIVIMLLVLLIYWQRFM